jgi:hypothetical protein
MLVLEILLVPLENHHIESFGLKACYGSTLTFVQQRDIHVGGSVSIEGLRH